MRAASTVLRPPLSCPADPARRRPAVSRRALALAVALALPPGAAAETRSAGHAALVLSSDQYSDEAFAVGREDGGGTLAPGVTVKYVHDPARFPLVGLGLTRWRSRLEGDCCGFEGTTVTPTFTSLDLLLGNLETSGDVREVWYFFAGASSVELEADFDTTTVPTIDEGHQDAVQFGLGFFAGPPGGFSGGFELRRTRLDDFAVTHLQLSVGFGF